MNLQPLFEMQKKLDDRIEKKKGLEGQDLLDKKILALQVELGELANEWRGFKFWSEDREPRYNTVEIYVHGYDGPGTNTRASIEEYQAQPILEEYVDCLHFILSIGLEHEFNETLQLAIEPLLLVDTTHQFTELMRTDWEIYEEGDGGYFHEGLELFLGLGSMLGFTWEQIETAYYDKNKVNHERQANGY